MDKMPAVGEGHPWMGVFRPLRFLQDLSGDAFEFHLERRHAIPVSSGSSVLRGELSDRLAAGVTRTCEEMLVNAVLSLRPGFIGGRVSISDWGAHTDLGHTLCAST